MFGPIRRTLYLRPICWISSWPASVAGLGEARRDENRARDVLLAALGQRAATNLAGIAKTATSNLAGDVFDRRVGLVTEDLVGLGLIG